MDPRRRLDGNPPVFRARRRLLADEHRLHLQPAADGELHREELFARIPVGLHPRQPYGEPLDLQPAGGSVLGQRHPVPPGLRSGRFSGGREGRDPRGRRLGVPARPDQRRSVRVPRGHHDRAWPGRRGVPVRGPVVQDLRLPGALRHTLQLPVEVPDGPAHHEAADNRLDPFRLRDPAGEPQRLHPGHGIPGIRRRVRHLPGVPGADPPVVRVAAATARTGDLEGPVARGRRRRPGPGPHGGVPPPGDRRDRGAVRVDLLGGRRPGRRPARRGGAVGAHDPEPDHHGLLHGALLLRRRHRHTDGDLPADLGPADAGDRRGRRDLLVRPVRAGLDRRPRLPRPDRGPLHHGRRRQGAGRRRLDEGVAVQHEHRGLRHLHGRGHRPREAVAARRHQLRLPVVVRAADDLLHGRGAGSGTRRRVVLDEHPVPVHEHRPDGYVPLHRLA
mmetsp:Transcript_1513/g.3824  ORF Transcript_1513/g.3824 Transcript_1513/m.3824 type:complete len:445 (-) Transcript_1513:30-1364(-)